MKPVTKGMTLKEYWLEGPGSVPLTPRVGVHLIGGSPALTLDGQPVIWFENWIRARTRSERMR